MKGFYFNKYLTLLTIFSFLGSVSPGLSSNNFTLTKGDSLKGDKKSASRGGLNLAWEELGPFHAGGRTTVMVADTIRNRIYAGSDGGGIFYSYDLGASWNNLTPDGENLVVSTIATAPNGDVYYGTGYPSYGLGNGIYKSTYGINFSSLASTRPPLFSQNNTWSEVTKIACHPTNSNIIYAGTGKGFFVSTDGGLSWSNNYITVGSITPTNRVNDVGVTSDGDVLVVMGGVLYYSPNGQQNTFSDITPTIGQGTINIYVAPSDPNVIYLTQHSLSGTLQGVWITMDKGITWTKITENSAIKPSYNGLPTSSCVDPNNAGVFIISGENTYRWTKLNSNPINGSWSKIGVQYPTTSFPSPYHPETKAICIYDSLYFLGTNQGVYSSPASNIVWTARNVNLKNMMMYSVGFSGTWETIGGTYLSKAIYLDGASTETEKEIHEVDESSGYTDISVLNNNFLFAGGIEGQLVRSTNKGSSWESFYSSPLKDYVSLNADNSYLNPATLWESFDDSTNRDSVYYFNYSGEPITAGVQISVPSNVEGQFFDFTLPVTLYDGDSIHVRDRVTSRMAIGVGRKVWVCLNPINKNEPSEWVMVSNSPSQIKDVVFTGDGKSIFYTTYNNIYRVDGISHLRSSDTINTATIPTAITVSEIGLFNHQQITDLEVDPNNSNNLIAAFRGYGGNNYIALTTDALTATDLSSANWDFKQGDGLTALPKISIYSVLIDMSDGNRVLVGTEYGVYSTSNIFAQYPTWTEENTGFPKTTVFMLRQQRHENSWKTVLNSGCIYAATIGRGIWRTCTLGSPTVSIDEESETKIQDLKIYPNPASEYSTIEITVPKSQSFTLKIFDLSGKLISTKSYGHLPTGTHKLNMELTELVNGTYLVSMEGSHDFRKIKRLVVSK